MILSHMGDMQDSGKKDDQLFAAHSFMLIFVRIWFCLKVWRIYAKFEKEAILIILSYIEKSE